MVSRSNPSNGSRFSKEIVCSLSGCTFDTHLLTGMSVISFQSEGLRANPSDVFGQSSKGCNMFYAKRFRMLPKHRQLHLYFGPIM